MIMNRDHEKIPFIDENVHEHNAHRISSGPTRESDSHIEMEASNSMTSGPNGSKISSINQFNVVDTTDTPIMSLPEGNGESNIKSFQMTSKRKECRSNSFNFPIHIAVKKGNVKTLEKLLRNGDPLALDFNKRTPLHHACGFGYQKKALKMVELILDCPNAQNTPEDPSRTSRLINWQDENGETGLHICARTCHRLIVEKLLFSAADVNLRDKKGIEPLQLIYSKVPAAMLPVFDGAVECLIGDPDDENLIVRLDFGSIVGYPEPEDNLAFFEPETKLLSYCLRQSEQKRAAILLHPIVQIFLFLKWKKIKILLWISILYHVVWLFLYTIFIVDLYLIRCPYIFPKDESGETNDDLAELNSTNESSYNLSSSLGIIYDQEDENRTDENKTTYYANAIACEIGQDLLFSLSTKLAFLVFVCASIAFKELYEIYLSPQLKFYFTQLENVGQWALIGVIGLTSIPVFVRDDDNRIFIYMWQYQTAALGIFLAWSLILCQVGKIPRFGIYIEILGKVLRSFGMFMVTFASLLVAFTISFQILMPEKAEFRNFWGFMKVMVMMAGEINYDEVFYNDEADADIPFPNSTKLLYASFVSVVTIILFNLLIGLTVSDTQGLQSIAQLTSLSSQLDSIYLMERFIISKKLQRRLKAIKKNHWLKHFLVTQQTDDVTLRMAMDIHISKIPRDIQHKVREIAIPNTDQEKDEDDYENISTHDKNSMDNEQTNLTKNNSSNTSLTHTDLKQQIKDILRELLDELKTTNQS